MTFSGVPKVALVVKDPPASARDIRGTGSIPGLGTHSHIVAWRIPEEPGELQSIGSQSVGHD